MEHAAGHVIVYSGLEMQISEFHEFIDANIMIIYDEPVRLFSPNKRSMNANTRVTDVLCPRMFFTCPAERNGKS